MNFEYVIFSLKNKPQEIRLGYIDHDLKETEGRTIHSVRTHQPIQRYLGSYLYVDKEYNVCSKNVIARIYNLDNYDFNVAPLPLEFANHLGDADFISKILPVLEIVCNTSSEDFVQDIKIINNKLNTENYLLFKNLFENNSQNIICQSENQIYLITNKFKIASDCFIDSNGFPRSSIKPITTIESVGKYFTIN